MDQQNVDIQEPVSKQTPNPEKKKKTRIWIPLLLAAVLIAIAAGSAFYLIQRQKPEKTVEQFLTCMQKMDLDGMSALLQSSDMSALDDADIRDAAYTEFFKNINQKMTFEITKNDFQIQSGTANVTVRIRYIDGTDIYKETISEFMRQIVATAFSGSELTEEETSQTLASILNEKASQLEDQFLETELTYPVIRADNTWKIVALDEETVKVMSANFKSVEEEITKSLNQEETDGTTAPQASKQDRLDLSTDKFSIRYTQHKTARDLAGNACLLVYYDYTNNGTAPSSAMVDVSLQAYQNGEACAAAIPESTEEAIDRFMQEIQPGETVTVCQAFSLQDTSDITLQVGEAFHFGDGPTASQILTIQ